MRLAFISDTLYPYFKGGIETVRHEEMVQLAKAHDVYSFSMRFDNMPSHFTKNGIHHIAFGETDPTKFYRHRRRSITNALKYAFLLPFHLFGMRFDVVEVNAFPYLHLPAVRLYCWLTGCKMIVSVYEVWDQSYWREYLGSLGFLSWLVNAYEKRSTKMGDFFICNSTSTSRKLVAEHIPIAKIREFSPVIDMEGIEKCKSKRKRGNQIAFAGRLIREKRLDLWLRAIKAAKAKIPSLKGLIIGEGPEEQDIRSLIHDLGLSGTVSMRRFYKSKNELYMEISRSALLLNMSEREGLSIITLEALSLGIPVLLPDYSPIPPEVKEMCIVAGQKELPGAIAEVLSGKASKQVNGTANLELFSISNVVEFYNKVFEEMGLPKE